MTTDLREPPTPSQPIPVWVYAPPARSTRRSTVRTRRLAVVVLLVVLGGAGVHHAVSRDDAATGTAAASGARPLSPGDPAPVEPAGVGDVEHLQPAVHRSVDRAVTSAAADGVTLRVTSGYRSATRQQQLYDEAIAKYGSPSKARRWVLPPGESQHVQGRAVDVGPSSAARWLERNGVRYGLCRRYDNEPWHFELLAPAKGQACPAREPHA